MTENKKPIRRLNSMKWKEISFVDRAANNRTFPIVKSVNKEDEKGGVNEMEDKMIKQVCFFLILLFVYSQN